MYIEKEDLFDNCEISGQFIMSGMEPDKAIPQNINAKRITDENEHYHLLQKRITTIIRGSWKLFV